MAMKSYAEAEKSRDHLSRDFLGLFDFRLLQQYRDETDARQGRWDVGQWPFATYCAAAAIPVANKAQRKLTGGRLLQNTTLVTQRRSGGLLDDFIRECEHRGRD
ncbi:MAG TPA: hypothetical protein VGD13_12225, partial [Xanthobacteraceae bacterium]